MPSPFSRTLRSLEQERSTHYIMQIGLFATLLFALLWGHWFLTAPLVAYETSHEISVTAEENIVVHVPQNVTGVIRPRSLQKRAILAKFPVEVIKRIQAGQSAFLHLENQEKQAIPAVVTEIIATDDSESGLVKLHTLLESTQYYPFTGEERGVVTIERLHGAPAHWVLRASGLGEETQTISVSPQPRY